MDKPELPEEEELNLSGPAPQNTSKKLTLETPKSPEENEQPKIQARVSKIAIPTGATDADVLGAILQAPQANLFVYELVDLPSGGRFYGWPDGIIRVRPMTQVAEKTLATQSLASSGQSLDYLFRECCQFPNNFDPINLLLGDRTFLLYYIRGITHGNLYEFVVPCPNPDCQQSSSHTYDLNELARTIKRVPDDLGTEPFKVSLPHLSEVTGRDVWVAVRFLRGIDGTNMLAKRKAKQSQQAHASQLSRNPLLRKQELAKRKNKLDDTITDNLMQVIVNAMGNDTPQVIHELLNKLHATDSTAIREWLREYTPGVDTTITITCPECDREFTVELPITETFFRPTSNRAS